MIPKTTLSTANQQFRNMKNDKNLHTIELETLYDLLFFNGKECHFHKVMENFTIEKLMSQSKDEQSKIVTV